MGGANVKTAVQTECPLPFEDVPEKGSIRNVNEDPSSHVCVDSDNDNDTTLRYDKGDDDGGCLVRMIVSVLVSQTQEYSLPLHKTSEVRAKIPYEMLVTVSKVIDKNNVSSRRLSKINTDGAMKKEDEYRQPTNVKTYAKQNFHNPGNSAASNKDEFTVNTFVEKHCTRVYKDEDSIMSFLNESTKRLKKKDGEVSEFHSPPIVNFSDVNNTSLSYVENNDTFLYEGGESPSRDQKSTTLTMSSRHVDSNHRAASKKLLEEDKLVSNLLKIHAKAVGLPLPCNSDGESDFSDDDNNGVGSSETILSLSDESSTNDELYEQSRLRLSPVDPSAFSSRKQSSLCSEKEKPEFRLMTDDDFDDDNHERDFHNDSISSELTVETSNEFHFPSKSLSSHSHIYKPICTGIEMDKKHLLQFSCSLADDGVAFMSESNCKKPNIFGKRGGGGVNQNMNDSIALSDDEDASEDYKKRIERNERLDARQSTFFSNS